MEAAVAAAMRELSACGASAEELVELRPQVVSRLVAAALAATQRSIGNAEPGVDPAPYAAARAAAGARPLLTAEAAAALKASGSAGPVVLPAACDGAPLHRELERLAATGKMVLTTQAAAGTRSDRVAWLSEAEADAAGLPALAAAIRSLKALTAELNGLDGVAFGGCSRLVVPARAQVAAFAQDDAGGYVPHWDATSLPQQPPGTFTNRRRAAAVLYACAPDWDAQHDGGCLRCHVGAPAPTGLGADAQRAIKEAAVQPPPWRFVDVAPTAGSCALFDATAVLHQVLPARRPRYAVTLWSYAPL